MDRMRRVVILAAALGYGLSFVAVCLAACLMGPTVSDHGCCPTDDGIRAADRDCCSVTPGVSHQAAQVSDAVPTVAAERSFAPTLRLPVTVVAPVATSASPPLVLRV